MNSTEETDSETETTSYGYVAITNIPHGFKTADLRCFFSEYVESGSFKCFHYRHRPEKNDQTPSTATGSRSKNSNYCCCVVKIKDSKKDRFLARYSNQNWIDCNDKYSKEVCEISFIKTETPEMPETNEDLKGYTSISELERSRIELNHFEVVPNDVLTQMPEMNPPHLMPQGNVGTPTTIFLDLIQKCLLPHNLIQKLNLKFPSCTGQRIYSNVGFDYQNRQRHKQATLPNQTWFDTGAGTAKIAVLSARCKKPVQKVSDSNNSAAVSKTCHKNECHDSVTKSDVEIIQNQKTDSDINKAGKSSKFDIQQTVHSEDSDDTHHVDEGNTANPVKKMNKDGKDFSIVVRNDKDASTSSDQKSNITYSNRGENSMKKLSLEKLSNAEIKRRKLEDRKLTKRLMSEGIEEHLIAVDKKWRSDDDAEEWDRHEASVDDPTNQGRCKERLYEEEIEQPWEKGGPGVVFWTDAIYWQAKEGDFDEQTTDDLDVDFSAYEEPGAGDKDIKDFLKIRQEQRWRNGIDSTDRFSIGIGKKIPIHSRHHNDQEMRNEESYKFTGEKIGAFEKHSKGIGRKVLEKQGWSDGQGLGSSKTGIAEALKGVGKKPYDKQGLGFINTKPVRYGIPPPNRTWTKGPRAITTIYDNPDVVDPKEPLLTRGEASTLKHTQSHINKFNSNTKKLKET